MKYNPFEIVENFDGERFGEIGGFAGAVVKTVSYGADGGGNCFLRIEFVDERVIRADERGTSGWIEIGTEEQVPPPFDVDATYAKLSRPHGTSKSWVDETYAKLSRPHGTSKSWVDETYQKLVGDKGDPK